MNPFRHLLLGAGSHPPIGTWIMSASPLVAEAIGHAGFDWGVLDMEHSPLDMSDVVHLLQAVGNTKLVPVVRVPWNDAVTVKRVLDAGATTIMFPFVQNSAEAARAVAATRYPPQGVRGLTTISRATKYGTMPDHTQSANRDMGVIVQLESPAALDELDSIAAVPGVDALFIGPGDLAAGMGHVGCALHPEVVARMTLAARRCAELGMPLGTLADNAGVATQYRAAGFTFVALGADLGHLMQGARHALRELRGQSSTPETDVHVHTLAEGTVVASKAR